jgi:hypothetical protein
LRRGKYLPVEPGTRPETGDTVALKATKLALDPVYLLENKRKGACVDTSHSEHLDIPVIEQTDAALMPMRSGYVGKDLRGRDCVVIVEPYSMPLNH